MHGTIVELAAKRVLPHTTIHVADRTYACATRQWWTETFPSWYSAFLTMYNASQWSTTSDCDDKADAFRLYAQLCHNNTRGGKGAEALAIGEIWIPGHAINLAFVEGMQPLWIEPLNAVHGLSIVIPQPRPELLAAVQFARF